MSEHRGAGTILIFLASAFLLLGGKARSQELHLALNPADRGMLLIEVNTQGVEPNVVTAVVQFSVRLFDEYGGVQERYYPLPGGEIVAGIVYRAAIPHNAGNVVWAEPGTWDFDLITCGSKAEGYSPPPRRVTKRALR
jgi:hypothetical protein